MTGREERAALVADGPSAMRGAAAELDAAGWAWAAGRHHGGGMLRLVGTAPAAPRGIQVTWARNESGRYTLHSCVVWSDGQPTREAPLKAARAAIGGQR